MKHTKKGLIHKFVSGKSRRGSARPTHRVSRHSGLSQSGRGFPPKRDRALMAPTYTFLDVDEGVIPKYNKKVLVNRVRFCKKKICILVFIDLGFINLLVISLSRHLWGAWVSHNYTYMHAVGSSTSIGVCILVSC